MFSAFSLGYLVSAPLVFPSAMFYSSRLVWISFDYSLVDFSRWLMDCLDYLYISLLFFHPPSPVFLVLLPEFPTFLLPLFSYELLCRDEKATTRKLARCSFRYARRACFKCKRTKGTHNRSVTLRPPSAGDFRERISLVWKLIARERDPGRRWMASAHITWVTFAQHVSGKLNAATSRNY